MAEHAQALIEDAHQQMAEARALAAEATAAAQEAADQAHAHVRAVAEKAEAQTGSAERVVEDAPGRGTLADEAARAVRAEQEQPTPARLSEHTKAELVELAQPLQIQGASRMTKDELVRAVRRAISGETAFLIKEGDVRIFHRKSRWQQLGEPGLLVEEITHQEGRSRRSHGCCRSRGGSSLFLSSEDERLRVPSLLALGLRSSSSAARQKRERL